MHSSTPLESQLLVTKFYVPTAPGRLIARPRLTSLLNKSLEYPLTLVSAAAGFGKTTLLSMWSQSLPANTPRIAWVSLDEEDNEPRLFWTYILTALNKQLPDCFTSLLMQVQSPQSSPLVTLLAELINLLVEQTDHFLLILDDYQVITEPQVHTTLAYLIKHLPAQLRIIVATRADPPLPLPQLLARGLALEVRTDQLRCTLEETGAFLHDVMGMQLPDETIQQVRSRTEGWLVGLQLLGLSLPERTDSLTFLQQVSGDQRYILDFLTQEVLERQPQEIQAFLLCTSILERLNASLCDAIMEQHGSQQMLQRLEQTNLFVVSLDSKRQWYRYHALFTEALYSLLQQRQADLVPNLHHRASRWYAEYGQTTQAILHALRAKEWEWVADQIERFSAASLGWRASAHELAMLWQWLEQLPKDVIASRPRLCLICTQILWGVAPQTMLDAWFDAAEARLTAIIHQDTSHSIFPPQTPHEQLLLLGEVIAYRALLLSFQGDGQLALSLSQKVLSLLPEGYSMARIFALYAQLWAYFTSSANNAVAAIESGLQAASLAQSAGHPVYNIFIMSATIRHMREVGRLREAYQLAQRVVLQGEQLGERALLQVGWSRISQAEILHEWNQLDTALALVEETIELCKQVKAPISPAVLHAGYALLLRIFLSRGELDMARSALQQTEQIGMGMNGPSYVHARSYHVVIDQVRLWLASGEIDCATRWAKELEIGQRQGTLFAHEREEVACARVLLAKQQPDLALERLEPVLQRATTGQRWGHVIEIRLLQALAHQMLQEEGQALQALSEAVRLAEPEGYIRSFVEEGAPMESLLYRLRRRNRKHGPTPYLDTLLAAFQQETKTHAQTEEPAQAYQLPEPLSQREREVLQLLVSGASNQDIAQELVIALDTVKRHTKHIFAKLGVHNRMQAAIQAQELGLLSKEM